MSDSVESKGTLTPVNHHAVEKRSIIAEVAVRQEHALMSKKCVNIKLTGHIKCREGLQHVHTLQKKKKKEAVRTTTRINNLIENSTQLLSNSRWNSVIILEQ